MSTPNANGNIVRKLVNIVPKKTNTHRRKLAGRDDTPKKDKPPKKDTPPNGS